MPKHVYHQPLRRPLTVLASQTPFYASTASFQALSPVTEPSQDPTCHPTSQGFKQKTFQTHCVFRPTCSRHLESIEPKNVGTLKPTLPALPILEGRFLSWTTACSRRIGAGTTTRKPRGGFQRTCKAPHNLKQHNRPAKAQFVYDLVRQISKKQVACQLSETSGVSWWPRHAMPRCTKSRPHCGSCGSCLEACLGARQRWVKALVCWCFGRPRRPEGGEEPATPAAPPQPWQAWWA